MLEKFVLLFVIALAVRAEGKPVVPSELEQVASSANKVNLRYLYDLISSGNDVNVRKVLDNLENEDERLREFVLRCLSSYSSPYGYTNPYTSPYSLQRPIYPVSPYPSPYLYPTTYPISPLIG